MKTRFQNLFYLEKALKGTVPNAKYIKDLQMRWKLFAEHRKMTRLDNQTVMGRNCVVIKHIESGRFVSFETSTRESFTGYQLTERQ
jgi:hypothetical protein